jgi:hypothetical protein
LQKGNSADRSGLLPITLVIVCSDKHRRNASTACLQQGMQFKPIHAGHGHVEKETCRPVYMRPIQTLATGCKELNLETERPDDTT